MVTELTNDTFKEFIENNKNVVVDFWAPWCGPCKVLSNTIDELANEYEGKVSFGKANVDDEEGLLTEYSIRTLPTVRFFKDGEKLLEILTGAQPKSKVKEVIEKNLF